MPSRRRTPSKSRAQQVAPASSFKSSETQVSQTALQRFAAALAESEAREKAAKAAERVRREEEARVAAEAAAHERSLQQARRELDRAIEAVKQARRDGRSTVAADVEWKRAKAALLQLETGERPKWAPPEPVVEEVEPSAEHSAQDDPDESSDYTADGSE
jgi:hypothetical protein